MFGFFHTIRRLILEWRVSKIAQKEIEGLFRCVQRNVEDVEREMPTVSVERKRRCVFFRVRTAMQKPYSDVLIDRMVDVTVDGLGYAAKGW